MTTVWQNIPSIFNSLIHENHHYVKMAPYFIIGYKIKKDKWTRGLRYKFQFMAKHEYWWPCRILGVGLADEGFERVTLRLTGRQNLSHQNSQYSDTQRHQKHQTMPRIPQPSIDIFNNTTWRRVLASLASRYAQQTKNTLCISIMLKSWPQSTGKQNDFSSFFFFKPLQAWLVREQTACYRLNSLPAV